MTLRDLKEQVAALPGHDLTPVNASGVNVEGGSIVFSFDASEAETERDELREEVADLKREAEEAERISDDRADELAKAKETLAEIKDDGGNLAAYRERMEQAELQCENWRKAYREIERECEVLRKRKGVGAGMVKNIGSIGALIREVAAGRAVEADKAKQLLAIITT